MTDTQTSIGLDSGVEKSALHVMFHVVDFEKGNRSRKKWRQKIPMGTYSDVTSTNTT